MVVLCCSSIRTSLWHQRGGETPQIQNIGNDGPEISDTEALRYFRDKLRQASKISFTRFEKKNRVRVRYTMSAEGIAREEIRFSKFIGRLRAKSLRRFF